MTELVKERNHALQNMIYKNKKCAEEIKAQNKFAVEKKIILLKRILKKWKF